MFGISKKKLIENYEKQLRERDLTIKRLKKDNSIINNEKDALVSDLYKAEVELNLLNDSACENFKIIDANVKTIEDLKHEKENLQSELKKANVTNEDIEKEKVELKGKLRTVELVRYQLINMTVYRNSKNQIVKTEDGKVLVHEVVDGEKVWDLARLL